MYFAKQFFLLFPVNQEKLLGISGKCLKLKHDTFGVT